MITLIPFLSNVHHFTVIKFASNWCPINCFHFFHYDSKRNESEKSFLNFI